LWPLERESALLTRSHTHAPFSPSPSQIATPLLAGLTGAQVVDVECDRLANEAGKRADAEARRLRAWWAGAMKKVEATLKAGDGAIQPK